MAPVSMAGLPVRGVWPARAPVEVRSLRMGSAVRSVAWVRAQVPSLSRLVPWLVRPPAVWVQSGPVVWSAMMVLVSSAVVLVPVSRPVPVLLVMVERGVRRADATDALTSEHQNA